MPLREGTLALPGSPRSQGRGLAFAALVAMIIPVAVPLITGSLLASNWPLYADRMHSRLVAVQIFAVCFGLFTAGMQYALQCRVRASDWAATPEASLRYRTYRGLNLGVVSMWPGFLLCTLFLRGLDRQDVMIVGIPVLMVTVGLLSWVRYQLEERSGSPKPDPTANLYRKFRFFYYNPNESAWVVPGRSGIGVALNHARAAVWLLDVLSAGILVGLLSLVRLAFR